MSKATTVKEAIKRFEEEKGVVAAEAEKVRPAPSSCCVARTRTAAVPDM